jgi:hypothetical protein
MPLGGLLGGLAVSGLGLSGALWLAAGCYALTTLAPFVLPAFRGFDRPQPAPAVLAPVSG